MKLHSLPIFLLLAFAISGYGSNATPNLSWQAPAVQDQASLISALQAAGATVETGDSITHEFFTPEGHTVKVNSADLQVIACWLQPSEMIMSGFASLVIVK